MGLLVVTLMCILTICSIYGQSSLYGFKRELLPNGRHLMHMHIESAEVYGNTTGLMYYYTNLYIGDYENPSKQSLILDTGSGITCFPCKDFCKECGTHLNSYYEVLKSNTTEFLDCQKDGCSCTNGNKCSFTQSYGEGSTYAGFWIKDKVYLDEQRHQEDGISIILGCVASETKLFKSQEADGIMGLSTAGNLKSKPIYYHLYDQKLVEHLLFSLCFGHNGGKFTVGGYDENLLIEKNKAIEWTSLLNGNQFKISLKKYKVGNIVMPNSPSKAFVDSGTTFVYMSQTQKNQIDRAFALLCDSKMYNCLGERTKANCYKFQPTKFFSVKDFYLSYPAIIFETQEFGVIKWLASEYFYKDK